LACALYDLAKRLESHPKPVPLENRLGVVRLLHGNHARTDREHKQARRRHEAARAEGSKDFAAEPPFFVGSDQPSTRFRQGQARGLALADDLAELRVARQLRRCCDRLLTDVAFSDCRRERPLLGRIGDLADHVFRDDELIARQGSKQGKVTSMDQVDDDVRVGDDDARESAGRHVLTGGDQDLSPLVEILQPGFAQ